MTSKKPPDQQQQMQPKQSDSLAVKRAQNLRANLARRKQQTNARTEQTQEQE